MVRGLRVCDRGTDLLLAPNIQDWAPADHVVRFIVPLAAQMPMQRFQFNRRRTGREQ